MVETRGRCRGSLRGLLTRERLAQNGSLSGMSSLRVSACWYCRAASSHISTSTARRKAGSAESPSGKHGDWTAEKARKKAEDYREIVRHGGDPLGAKRALRESATVSDILDAYLASEAFEE